MDIVTFNLRKSDLIGYCFYLLPRHPSNRILALILFIGSLAYFGLTRDLDEPYQYAIAIFVAAVSAIAPLLACFAFNAVVTLISPLPGIVGTHKLELSPEGLRESTQFNDSLHNWSAVEFIGRTSTLITFHLNRNTMFFLLPRRDFESEEALEAFLARAHALKAEHENHIASLVGPVVKA